MNVNCIFHFYKILRKLLRDWYFENLTGGLNEEEWFLTLLIREEFSLYYGRLKSIFKNQTL